jgi:hypothetical protein
MGDAGLTFMPIKRRDVRIRDYLCAGQTARKFRRAYVLFRRAVDFDPVASIEEKDFRTTLLAQSCFAGRITRERFARFDFRFVMTQAYAKDFHRSNAPAR